MQFSMFDGKQEFRFKKPIRLIEFFAGYGSQALALKELGVKFSHWKICEWAIKSIQAYKDNHFKDENEDYSKLYSTEFIYKKLAEMGISSNYNEPLTLEQVKRLGETECRKILNNILTTHNLVNISRVRGEDLQICDTDKYDYILTYSFPCFTADSLVLTRNGYKRICDIDYGDFVLSHDNKYHKVVNIFNNGTHDIYKINAMCVDEIKTTLNHKFYVREMFHKGHKRARCFKQPIWKELRELTKNDYLGIAINQENRALVSNKLPMQNEHFWWIIGRYLGDGWIRTQQGIIICCDKAELGEIAYHLDKLDWHYNIVEERTVLKIHIPKKALSDFVSQFGNGAGNKHLTQDILDLPIHYLTPFIKGYMSADGCFTNGLYKATSISRELIYGVAQCVAKVYKTPYRIYKVEPPKTKIIENRLVNQNSWYQLVFKTEKRKQDKAFYENGYIWYPIKSIEYIGKNNVYDIEVEDSHSFTVQNTIVHNCQDLSKAGKGKGMARDSGTRSGLLWEVERILDECAELGALPQILLMENVPDVIGSKNLPHFRDWRDKLESMGYKCYWQVLNSKDYGIPQNRERCFMISILGDYYFSFPQSYPLINKLMNILEQNVDEKYYLSDKIGNEYPIVKNNKNYIEWKQKGFFESDCRAWKINEISGTLTTNGKAKIFIPNYDYIDNLFLAIFDLCDIIDNKEKEKYERTRNLLSILWQEIGKEEIWKSFRRFWCIQEKEILQQRMYENVVSQNGKFQSRISQCSSNSCQHIQSNSTREKMLNMWEKWKIRYTPQRWELSKQQFKQFNLFMSQLSYETTQKETDMYYLWETDESTRLLRETLSKIQEIWKPTFYKEQSFRVRKLAPIESFRLMGVRDKDFENIAENQSRASLYHLAGDSIVVAVLVAILSHFVDGFDFNKYIENFYEKIKENADGKGNM